MFEIWEPFQGHEKRNVFKISDKRKEKKRNNKETVGKLK